MAVSYKGLPKLLPVQGVRIATASAGIKKPGRKDVTLFELMGECTVAATFTRNLFCAAPVIIAREYLAKQSPYYLLINTGNANAGTGKTGLEHAKQCCHFVADAAGCDSETVLPFSTGVIGEPLPVERIQRVVPELLAGLSTEHWQEAASAILTTDTVPKGACRKLKLSSGEVVISGIAKGSGMIRPDMATMLAFVATDALIPQNMLDELVYTAVDQSFNRITVDGDTSTNDASVLIATGASGTDPTLNDEDMVLFTTALIETHVELAQQIVKDGEGATKFVTIDVVAGKSEEECKQVAYTIAHSPLVKTALFASDPNWGRILAAVGRSGISDLNLSGVNIYLGEVCIVRQGEPAAEYTEEKGAQVVSADEITIRVELNRGDLAATVWTCDFSYDYVKINAEYRT